MPRGYVTDTFDGIEQLPPFPSLQLDPRYKRVALGNRGQEHQRRFRVGQLPRASLDEGQLSWPNCRIVKHHRDKAGNHLHPVSGQEPARSLRWPWQKAVRARLDSRDPQTGSLGHYAFGAHLKSPPRDFTHSPRDGGGGYSVGPHHRAITDCR